METLTRQDAIKLGLKRYHTGVECPYGHIADRLVSTRACSECIRGKKHKWNENNPEKVNAQKRSWRNRNIEKARRLNLANQKLHRDKANERNRSWYSKNAEVIRAKNAKWEELNPEKVAARVARRRAAKLRQMPKWADKSAINMIYRAARVIRTTGFDVHVDHRIPLQGKLVRGLHVHNNLKIIAAKANRSKSNHLKEH